MKIVKIPYNIETDFDTISKHLLSKGWMYRGCGSDNEPYSTKWCESLDEGFIDKNNYCIIDWGCGYGRFLNYLLSKGIDKFKYYGFELHGEKNGDLLIDFCNTHYLDLNNSNRIIKFGYIDNTKLVDEATQNCNTILLGSVFTHMLIEDILLFLEKFDNFIINGGTVVFSLIIEKNRYDPRRPGAYGITSGYRVVFHSINELQKLCRNDRYKIQNICKFQTSHVLKHDIFRLTVNR